MIAGSDDIKVKARIAAVPLLGRDADQQVADIDQLDILLAPQVPAELRQAALRALGKLQHDKVAQVLLSRWNQLSPASRAQALDILMSRESFLSELLTAVADDTVARSEFDAARRQRLVDHRSAEIRKKAVAAFATTVDA